MSLKIAGVIVLLIVMISILAEESRSFYCLSDGQCVTVWKRSANKCYIVLDKYYGLVKPTDNYIETTNSNFCVDVIWTNDNRLLIDSSDDVTITQPSSNKNFVIERYIDNKAINDSLYTYFDGTYNKYNKKVDVISLYIKENYARIVEQRIE
jgi:hypothetical protein